MTNAGRVRRRLKYRTYLVCVLMHGRLVMHSYVSCDSRNGVPPREYYRSGLVGPLTGCVTRGGTTYRTVSTELSLP